MLRQNPDKYDYFTAKKYYSVCNLAYETGFVYMHVDISKTPKKKLMIQVDQT